MSKLGSVLPREGRAPWGGWGAEPDPGGGDAWAGIGQERLGKVTEGLGSYILRTSGAGGGGMGATIVIMYTFLVS